MALLLNWVEADGSAHQAVLDAAVNENHQTSAQVTEHQVEQGVNITDHIRPMPKRISIEGIITNTPIVVPTTYMNGVGGSQKQTTQMAGTTSPNPVQVKFTTLQFDSQVDRVKLIYGDLVTAALNGMLFSVTTSLASYTNMAITDLSVPRNVNDGNVLHFNIEMQEVRIVQTTTVNTTPSKITPVNKGKKTPVTLDETKDVKPISFAKAVLNSFGGG